MTLKEAIEHATEISETCDNKECGLDHKQLANWLTELEELRKEHKQNVMNMLATDYAENHTPSVEYRLTNCTVRDFYNANKDCAMGTKLSATVARKFGESDNRFIKRKNK